MEKLAERTLGEFLSRMVEACALGLLFIQLVAVLEFPAQPPRKLLASGDGMEAVIANGLLVILILYILGEMVLVIGNALISGPIQLWHKCMGQKEKTHWEMLSVIGVKNNPLLIDEFKSIRRRHDFASGFSGACLLAVVMHMIALFLAANPREEIIFSLYLPLTLLALAAIVAGYFDRQLRQLVSQANDGSTSTSNPGGK